MQTPESLGTGYRRTHGEGAAPEGDRGSRPGQMKKSSQRRGLAASGEEDGKHSGLVRVEAEGGRRQVVGGESRDVGRGGEPCLHRQNRMYTVRWGLCLGLPAS